MDAQANVLDYNETLLKMIHLFIDRMRGRCWSQRDEDKAPFGYSIYL